MSQDNDQTMTGNAVNAAGAAVETVANQVEGAVQEATEFASDNVLGRLIGYIRAGKKIADGALEGGIDTAQSARQNVVGDFGDDFLRELDEFREKAEQAIKQAASSQE